MGGGIQRFCCAQVARSLRALSFYLFNLLSPAPVGACVPPDCSVGDYFLIKFVRPLRLSAIAALGLLAGLCVSFFACAQSVNAFVAVALTATPDPVRPGELVQYAITVTNRTASSQFYSITAPVPNHTKVASNAVSSGGGCGLSSCPAGTIVTWGSHSIAAGQSDTVQFAALVDTASPPPNGTLISTTAAATANGNGASAAVDVVVSTADLSLSMTTAPSAVVPGGTLSYTLEFANPAATSSPATLLELPLPPGTSVVSATGGGTLSAGAVQWSVGALPPGGSGQRQLVLQVDPTLTNGSILSAAVDWRDAVSLRSLARATAATAVLTNAGTVLALTATPDPVRPGELVQYAITVTNRTASSQVYTHCRAGAQPHHGGVQRRFLRWWLRAAQLSGGDDVSGTSIPLPRGRARPCSLRRWWTRPIRRPMAR